MTPAELKSQIISSIKYPDCSDGIIDAVLSSVFSFYPLTTVVEDQKMDGNGTQKLFFHNFPIQSVSKFECKNNADWEAYTDYEIISELGFIFLNSGTLPRGYRNINVSYTYGYDTVPNDMIGAIVDMVNYQYEINKRGNISSESIDDYRVVFDTTIPSHITSTFSKYKRLYV